MKLDTNIQFIIGVVLAIIIVVGAFMLISNQSDSPTVLSAQITEDNKLLQPPGGRCSSDGVGKSGEKYARPEFSHYMLVECSLEQVCCYENSGEPMGVCAKVC